MYDLILQNNTTKRFYIFQELVDIAPTELYLEFENVEMDIPDGEYTYAVFINDRDDVTYDFKTPILDTIIHTDEEDVILKNIQPYTGLLRVGEVNETNNYDDVRNNNTIYYEG